MATAALTKRELKKIYPALEVLKSLKNEKLKIILPYLNDKMYESICECICNCITNEKITSQHKKKLKKLSHQKEMLRYLIRPDRKIGNKKKKVVQVGGSLSLLLGLGLPILANFIFSKLKKKRKFLKEGDGEGE